MNTKYPIILVHGIMLKDILFIKAFGRIEKKLSADGYSVHTADHDGMGSIENNARQLKAFIEKVLLNEDAEKVNIIAHSKGGLDSLYMINNLDMEDKVSSITFLCTPHKGSVIADKLYSLPRPIRGTLAFWLNLFYKMFGDESPDSLTVCRQLCTSPDGILSLGANSPSGILMQSFSSKMESSRDDFIMSIPHIISHYYSVGDTDGMVSAESSKFAFYRGHCVEGSVSHSEIVDFMTNKNKREKIYTFYSELCRELAELGH